MGQHNVENLTDRAARGRFVSQLLRDVCVLEEMIAASAIESGVVRIGAEQEMCIIDRHMRPSKVGSALLGDVDDPHFTTELAHYNLEVNLDPVPLEGVAFTRMERSLRGFLARIGDVAARRDCAVLLCGILPTISKQEVALEYMTDSPRYFAIDRAIRDLRGRDFDLYIKGVDELLVSHHSVLFEACNTSFQLHLQVDAERFCSQYNWAQAIAGPLLAVSVNSPLLLGRELWSETRIALFQQSVDTRRSSYALKDQSPRVAFGRDWAQGGLADIFREDIARFRALLGVEIKEDSRALWNAGKVPKLAALQIHNGTIYPWNRACYGASGDKAHVRIENRYLPAGPSVRDELANFALWVGLMKSPQSIAREVHAVMDFRDVKANFVRAARAGLHAQMFWPGGYRCVRDLMEEVLLPMAAEGLAACGIAKEEADQYLGLITARLGAGTGADWQVRNYRRLQERENKEDAVCHLTSLMHKMQQTELPVSEWADVSQTAVPLPHALEGKLLVKHRMSTHLFTVDQNDPANLAVSIMRWKNIHHVPVEADGALVGLLTWSMIQTQDDCYSDTSAVADVMLKQVDSVSPDTPLVDAMAHMKRRGIGCLPVVDSSELVGILTIRDLAGTKMNDG